MEGKTYLDPAIAGKVVGKSTSQPPARPLSSNFQFSERERAAGQALLPLAQEAMRQVKHIEETMWSLKGVLIGELSIACSTTVGKYVLPRLVAGFRRKYPDVRVTVNIMSRRAAIDCCYHAARTWRSSRPG